MVFLEKLEFFRIGKGGKFVIECVSNDIISEIIFFGLIFWRQIYENKKIFEKYFLKK